MFLVWGRTQRTDREYDADHYTVWPDCGRIFVPVCNTSLTVVRVHNSCTLKWRHSHRRRRVVKAI